MEKNIFYNLGLSCRYTSE